MTKTSAKPVVAFRATPEVIAALKTYANQAEQEHGQPICTSNAVEHLIEEQLLQLKLITASRPWPPSSDYRVQSLQNEVNRLTRELATIRSQQPPRQEHP